jgi:hypothetical protein
MRVFGFILVTIAALASLGRAGKRVPSSSIPAARPWPYYAPGKPVEILPQVLTTGRLVSLVG